jgi:hypothetical protein
MVLPGQTPYTLGSELENAETSAWGRAIAAVGLATRGGIATADEIRSKQTADEPTEDQPDADTPTDAPPPVAAKEGASSALPVDATTTVPRSLDGKTDEQIRAMTYEVLIELAREKFIPSATITKTGRTMFGEGHTLRQLTDEQRQQLWHALLTGELPGDEHTASPQASEPSTTSS